MRRTNVWLFSTCLVAALAGTAMLLGTSSSLAQTTTATPGSPTASIGSSAVKASRGARIDPPVKGTISSRLGTTSTDRAEVWNRRECNRSL
jgi:hypothetical protein